MADGDHGREFVAMITAVREWAETQKGWDHPLKAIKDALLAADRRPGVPDGHRSSEDADGGRRMKADWDDFQSRTTGDTLFFDYTIQM